MNVQSLVVEVYNTVIVMSPFMLETLHTSPSKFSRKLATHKSARQNTVSGASGTSAVPRVEGVYSTVNVTLLFTRQEIQHTQPSKGNLKSVAHNLVHQKLLLHQLLFRKSQQLCTGNGPNGTDVQCRAVVEYSCVIAMSPQRCHQPLVSKPTSNKRSNRNFATHRSAPH